MKKSVIYVSLLSLVLSSCGSYMGNGAYAGTSIGSILGSAIGGIAEGPRGADIGTIIGMAGGAVIGGVIGNAKDKQRQRDYEEYERDKAERAAARAGHSGHGQIDDYATVQDDNYGSGFDETNSGDDRLYDFNSSDYTGDYSAQQATTTHPSQSHVEGLVEGLKYSPAIEVRNARFVDDNQDGQIQRGEVSKIIFEVFNTGTQALCDVQPTVVEVTGNKHILVSPNMHVEKIEPGKGIRYTAVVQASNRLKNGTARFCVSVIQGGKAISKISEFNIPTRK